MPRIMDVKDLRKDLGLKKLKKKIHFSDAEKEAILNLRERDRRRVERTNKVKA